MLCLRGTFKSLSVARTRSLTSRYIRTRTLKDSTFTYTTVHMYTLFVNTRSHLHSLRIYSLTFTLVGKYKFTFTHIYFSPTRCVRDDYMRRCTCTCAYFLLVCKFRVSVTTCEGGYMCKCVFRVYVQISCLYVTTCVGKYMCR